LRNVGNLIPSLAFELSFSQEHRELLLQADNLDEAKWLQFVLLKKIESWMENCLDDQDQQRIETHQLIESESYNEVYNELKEKYGKKLEDGWEESTDPKKFIYEDIAIASYLIVLWRKERSENDKLQKFVDLGCGNGLLVFILSQVKDI
jgi:tRNASer (uridine44-2'-O)-methyltransferase